MGILRSTRRTYLETFCILLHISNLPPFKAFVYVGSLLHYLERQTQQEISLDFIELSKDWTIREDQTMVLFDLVSLFTNVPTYLAIQVAKRRLEGYDRLKERTELTAKEVLCFLKFYLDLKYFTFQRVVYRQKYETAVGSPVSVTVVNLVI